MKKRLKVLLIGANGRIGRGFVEMYLKSYKKNYELILGMHHVKKIHGFKVIKVDITNLQSLKKSFKGINVVINLAANPNPNANFEDLVKPNIIGVYNVFEASRLCKVKRVIIASSIHAVKGYPKHYAVKPGESPKPLNFYGATKVFAESLCYVFSTKYNLSCLAIRIGAYIADNKKTMVCFTRKDLDHAISQRDLSQLIHKTIIAPTKVKYGILSGISNNKYKHLELDMTKKLIGYNPKDDEFNVCKEIKKKVKGK